MPNFYTYQNPYPSQLATAGQGHWEDPADWPRTFIYVTNQAGTQGIHPPAPIYQAGSPSQPNMYYYQVSEMPSALDQLTSLSLTLQSQGNPSTPGGYVTNGVWYPSQPAAAAPGTGWPFHTCYPLPIPPASTSPMCNWAYGYSPYCTAPQPFQVASGTPWNATAAAAQVAAVIAANAALAQAPNAPSYFVGTTAAEIQNQNAILQANLYHLAASQAQQQQQPSQIAPYKPGTGPQFWCKETDGSWTLRDQTDAATLGAGHWETHATSGYHFFVKHAA